MPECSSVQDGAAVFAETVMGGPAVETVFKTAEIARPAGRKTTAGIQAECLTEVVLGLGSVDTKVVLFAAGVTQDIPRRPGPPLPVQSCVQNEQRPGGMVGAAWPHSIPSTASGEL